MNSWNTKQHTHCLIVQTTAGVLQSDLLITRPKENGLPGR